MDRLFNTAHVQTHESVGEETLEHFLVNFTPAFLPTCVLKQQLNAGVYCSLLQCTEHTLRVLTTCIKHFLLEYRYCAWMLHRRTTQTDSESFIPVWYYYHRHDRYMYDAVTDGNRV